MALPPLSETNISESVSRYLATQLLAAGYLVYWQNADAVQTPDGFYCDYQHNHASYAADPTFAGRLAAATGLLTLTGKWSANPQYAVRPKNDGTGSPQDEVQVPYLSLEVGPWVTGVAIGLGDTTRWRSRHLVIYGATRDDSEQSRLRDALAGWLDEDTMIDIADHDGGTLAVQGTARATMVTTDSTIVGLSPNAATFEVVYNAMLEVEA